MNTPDFQNNPSINQSTLAVDIWMNHLQERNLKTVISQWKNNPIVSVIDTTKWDKWFLEYAFEIQDKQLIQIKKFDLCVLRTKWQWKKQNWFYKQILKEPSHINKVNVAIDTFIETEKNKSNLKEKPVKNPNFPDNTYIYTNKYWKEFKVVTMWWKAINITCKNNYIPWYEKGAITRAINANRLHKFKEFIPTTNTSLQVVDKISNSVASIIDKNAIEWELIFTISDNLEIIYMNFENLKRNSDKSIHTSKILTPALSILKLLITDFEISSEDLQYMLSTEELTKSLFENISNKLQSQLENNDYNKITLILATLKLIFIERISQQHVKNSTHNDNNRNDQNPEDLDIWDDVFTSWFKEKEDISEENAWSIFIQWHRANNKAQYTGPSNNANI